MGLLSKLTGLFAKSPSRDKKLPRINVEKRFELIGRTGQGSMSKVWRARDRQTAKVVCLKILDKEKTARFEARFPGLKRPSEGAVLMMLRHPNIVTTFEHGLTTKGEPYLMMELIEGVGLNFLIETKSPQLKGKRIHYLTQMADALQFMHDSGFLHRDICPRNVMVTRDDQIKLIDFGLSIPYTPEFCRPGNRTGSANYMAPELIKRLATDHRVDLFALGVTAYEMIVGDLPWEKGDSSQTLQSHINSPGRDPRDFKKDLDPVTAKFLIKCIEREPDDRFQTAAEFREALKKLPPL